MELTLGELTRNVAALRDEIHDHTARVDRMQEMAERTYLRQDVADRDHRTTDIQIQGLEQEIHSLHKRVDANQRELLARISTHDAAHAAEHDSRISYRRQVTVALTAAILSPVVAAAVVIFGTHR